MQVFAFDRYDCAGIWYDTHMQPCLLVRVQWDENEWSEVLLYPRQRKLCCKGICGPNEWCIGNAGQGRYLEELPCQLVVLRGAQ